MPGREIWQDRLDDYLAARLRHEEAKRVFHRAGRTFLNRYSEFNFQNYYQYLSAPNTILLIKCYQLVVLQTESAVTEISIY